MKILAVNASHRGKEGYTQFLIDLVFDGARAVGADCETVVLAEHDVKRCTGCFSCQEQGHLKQCIYEGKDDTPSIYNKMREADLIIFATPVYIFQMSSLLLNLFDRYPSTGDCSRPRIAKSGLFFHDIDENLCSKPFVTIICQDNIEDETHRNIISYFKTYSAFMDAPYVGSLVRRSGAADRHGKDKAKLSSYPILKEAYGAFYRAGEELVQHGRIRRHTEITANRKIVSLPPFVRILVKLQPFRKTFEEKSKAFMETK